MIIESAVVNRGKFSKRGRFENDEYTARSTGAQFLHKILFILLFRPV
jgi:hypothetical protein